MKSEIKKQIALLKKYGVTNYTIENERIIINGTLYLGSLEKVNSNFLKNTIINGGLNLYSLKFVNSNFLKNTIINGGLWLKSLGYINSNFLKNTTINGGLWLNSLKKVNSNFLKNTLINGDLYLDSLESINSNFLKTTTINGGLDLNSLKSINSNFLKNTLINGDLLLYSLENKDKIYENIKNLSVGYNEVEGYCYFDEILSKVLKVTKKKDYVIYETPFEFVVQKGEFTAHSKTVKKGIIDVEFKIISEKLKKEPITKETMMTVAYYRLLTGACDLGCRNWLEANEIPFKIIDDETIEVTPILAKDLLPILEKTNAYGLRQIKELLVF